MFGECHPALPERRHPPRNPRTAPDNSGAAARPNAAYLPYHGILDGTIDNLNPTGISRPGRRRVPSRPDRALHAGAGPPGSRFHDRVSVVASQRDKRHTIMTMTGKTGARPPRRSRPSGTPAQAGATAQAGASLIKDAPAMQEISGIAARPQDFSLCRSYDSHAPSFIPVDVDAMGSPTR